MTKLILPAMCFLGVVVLGSIFLQSQILSVIDLAAILMVIAWFRFSPDSEETAWLLCLAISITFGLFRQQNIAILIVGLTLSLIMASLLSHVVRTADYFLTVILGLFSILALILFWINSTPDIVRGAIYVVINTALAYAIQLILNRRLEGRAAGYKYK